MGLFYCRRIVKTVIVCNVVVHVVARLRRFLDWGVVGRLLLLLTRVFVVGRVLFYLSVVEATVWMLIIYWNYLSFARSVLTQILFLPFIPSNYIKTVWLLNRLSILWRVVSILVLLLRIISLSSTTHIR